MTKPIFSVRKMIIVMTTTVFSISSSTTAFFTMGLKSLFWLALAAILYFLPFAMMSAEFTSAYPKSSGSLYDWLADSLTPKIAFITTFVWYASYFVWMTSLILRLWIPFGLLVFGRDVSQMPTVFGISTKVVLMLLSLLGLFILTIIINQGFLKIAKLMYFAAILTTGLVVLIVGLNLVLSFQHPEEILPHIKNAMTSNTFFETSNLTGFLAQLPFMIFAVTAFGGLDTVSSLVEKIGNQQHKFSKALLLSGGLVLVFYFLNIISLCIGTDFAAIHTSSQNHLGNLMYRLMAHLSGQVSTNALFREICVRYTALMMFVSYLALLVTIGYAPLKVLLHASHRLVFPHQLLVRNKHGIHFKAVQMQALIIGGFIILVSIGMPFVNTLYNHLTLMTNVSRSLPYLIVACAYPFFKAKFSGEYLKLVHHKSAVKYLSLSVVVMVSVAIVFEIYATLISDGLIAGIFLIIGPLFFALLANYLYGRHADDNDTFSLSDY